MMKKKFNSGVNNNGFTDIKSEHNRIDIPNVNLADLHGLATTPKQMRNEQSNRHSPNRPDEHPTKKRDMSSISQTKLPNENLLSRLASG